MSQLPRAHSGIGMPPPPHINPRHFAHEPRTNGNGQMATEKQRRATGLGADHAARLTPGCRAPRPSRPRASARLGRSHAALGRACPRCRRARGRWARPRMTALCARSRRESGAPVRAHDHKPR
eukprot:4183084-Prymnesium_polylepis.2